MRDSMAMGRGAYTCPQTAPGATQQCWVAEGMRAVMTSPMDDQVSVHLYHIHSLICCLSLSPGTRLLEYLFNV